jgi:hypothetical protein
MEGNGEGMDKACFKVSDRELDEWDLCTNDGDDSREWVCAIAD